MKNGMALNFIALASCLLLWAGCATQAPQKEGAAQISSARLEQAAKQYRERVQNKAESKVSPAHCMKLASDVKAHWDWKSAVGAADACMASHDLARTEEIGNMLASHEPAGAWGPYFLSSVARMRGQFERAQWMAELAIKRAPENAAVHYLKAQILWAKKEYGAAVFFFEKSVQLDESLVPAHMFLGQVYFRDQDYPKAAKHFYAVLKFEPHNTSALTGLAESQLRDSNPRGALDAYQRLADNNPGDGQYLTRMAEIYEGVLNDVPQALAVYKLFKEQVRTARIKKNIDPQLDAKIHELEQADKKSRSLASSEEKASKIR